MYIDVVRISSFFILILLLNCKGTAERTDTKLPESNELWFETVMTEQMCNFDKSTLLKISSQEALQEVYNKINSTRKPGLPTPQIDFSKYDLIFYSLGSLSTGGHTLEVISVKQQDDHIVVNMGGASPGPGENAITVITSPGILLKIEKSPLPVVTTF